MTAWVTIMSNRKNGTLYVGVGSDLPQRVHDHREGTVEGFTQRYRLHRLVHVETHPTMV
jgi:putative endonuclease